MKKEPKDEMRSARRIIKKKMPGSELTTPQMLFRV